MPRVIFINRYFFPDHSSSSQILSDLAFYLAERGEDVHVIAGRQIYDDPKATLPTSETIRNVHVHRVSTTRFGRTNLLGRAIDYASFYASGAIALLSVARSSDVVVAESDPPLLSILTAAIAALRGFKRINWIQDIYPELAMRLGIGGLHGWVGRFMIWLRNRSLISAAMNIVIGGDMLRCVAQFGIPKERIRIVNNWSDDEQIVPMEARSSALRQEWALGSAFVVAYSGNLGRAHDTETILSAAELLHDRRDIVFLFVGGGKGMTQLAGEVSKRKLGNFKFVPYQPRERLSESLGAADIHWLSLKPGLGGLLLPSKFYGIAAAGRPIVVVAPMEDELARLVNKHHCGLSVESGQGEVLARGIALLADDKDLRKRMGENARTMLDKAFTKAEAHAHWRELLLAVKDGAAVSMIAAKQPV